MRKLAALFLTVVLLPLSSCTAPFESMEISIESLPPEAKIYVGGEFFGLTPRTIQVPANAEITVSLDGYKEETFFASDPNETLIRLRLKQYFDVMLNYTPEGSEIFEGGKFLGVTPLVIRRTSGKINLVAKHEYHFDYEDNFDVAGPVIRAKSLKPKVRYFPDTECMISTEPQGVQVIHIGIKDGEIVSSPTDLGTTPFNITNAELFKLAPERLLLLKKEGYLPSVIRCTGSFSAHVNLIKGEAPKIELPKDFVSTITYASGELTNESELTLLATPVEGKFKISNPNFEVSIVDLETNLTKDSGAGFYKDRFFAVRTNDAMANIKYIAYDTLSKKRVRLENMAYYRELDVAGEIAYRQRVPIVKGKFEIFSDFAYEDKGSNGLFFVKPFGEKSPIFVIKSDSKMEKPQILQVITY